MLSFDWLLTLPVVDSTIASRKTIVFLYGVFCFTIQIQIVASFFNKMVKKSIFIPDPTITIRLLDLDLFAEIDISN